MSVTTITITKPDDWHLHLRDGDRMKSVVNYSARQCERAVIMPNLQPPITTVAMASDYYASIKNAVANDYSFEPLMTLYLTESTSVIEIEKIHNSVVKAVKLYPAGATTNSDDGVRDIEKVYPILEKMQELAIPLLVHGETVNAEVDIFDREKVFIEMVLQPIIKKFPQLKIVCEHITTADMVDFVNSTGRNIVATITPQHLLFNRNNMLVGGIKPHYYCLPILKREKHRQSLLKAATSGSPNFFLGSDSAPHAKSEKESACGCAGVFSAPILLELYATVFEMLDALDKLEGFASFFGADFYGLPRNETKIMLQKQEWGVPSAVTFGDTVSVPILHGQKLAWKLYNL